MKVKLKKKLQNNGPRLKFNLEKLKDLQVADLFEAKIGGRFAGLNWLEENMDNLTRGLDIHGTLTDTFRLITYSHRSTWQSQEEEETRSDK